MIDSRQGACRCHCGLCQAVDQRQIAVVVTKISLDDRSCDHDIAGVQRKIFENPNIPDLCGHRLEIGK